MRSKILVSIIGVLLLALVGVWRIAVSSGNRNNHIADCNIAVTWWNTRGSLRDNAQATLDDTSGSLKSAQMNALVLVASLVSWEEGSKLPPFAQVLVTNSIVEDKQWENNLRSVLGQPATTPTTDEFVGAMTQEHRVFEQVRSVCGWSDQGAPVDLGGGAVPTAT